MDPPLDLSFMNSKVSKNNSSERRGKVIMRENLQLLKLFIAKVLKTFGVPTLKDMS